MATTSNKLSKNLINEFLTARKRASPLIATGVMLCILAASPLLLLISLNAGGIFSFPNKSIVMLGVIILLIIVAIGCGFLIMGSHFVKIHHNLEYENCELSATTQKNILNQYLAYANTHLRLKIAGVALCILAAVPILASIFLTDFLANSNVDAVITGSVSLTLLLIAVGVFLIVKTDTISDSFKILLQIDDYSPSHKAARKAIEKYSDLYWLIITLIYLAYSFSTYNWHQSWVVWPLAGILYSIIENILSFRNKKALSE